MNTNIKFIIVILLLFVICLTYELITKYGVEKFKTRHNTKIQYKFIFVENKNYVIVCVKDLIENKKKIYKIFNK